MVYTSLMGWGTYLLMEQQKKGFFYYPIQSNICTEIISKDKYVYFKIISNLVSEIYNLWD